MAAVEAHSSTLRVVFTLSLCMPNEQSRIVVENIFEISRILVRLEDFRHVPTRWIFPLGRHVLLFNIAVHNPHSTRRLSTKSASPMLILAFTPD